MRRPILDERKGGMFGKCQVSDHIFDIAEALRPRKHGKTHITDPKYLSRRPAASILGREEG